MVGVSVLMSKADAIEIDTFLMSCRVLGRGVENAVFAAMAEHARLLNARKLRGRYIPTPKNSLVADLYREHGFQAMGDGYWEADELARFEWPEHIARFARYITLAAPLAARRWRHRRCGSALADILALDRRVYISLYMFSCRYG